MNIRFTTESATDLDVDVLVWAVTSDAASELAPLTAILGEGLLSHLEAKKFKAEGSSKVVVPPLGQLKASTLVIVSGSDVAHVAGTAGKVALDEKATTAAVVAPGLSEASALQLVEFIHVGNYKANEYLPEKAKGTFLTDVTIVSDVAGGEAIAAKAAVRARYQLLCRDLVDSPPADLYPETLAARASKLGELDGVDIEVWDFDTCRSKGLVGVIAVGQGSSRPGVMIKGTYRHPDATDHIALVGKGVTFDAGGLSLKPSNAMQTMRSDMGGAATAISAFGAIAELGLPINVDLWVPSVENMCGANSFKLGDILRYNNGVTVEIHNTDAEGRLILADALILASETEGVSTVVDMATLTGAILIALGGDYTGLFTQSDELASALSEASAANHELIWRLPLDKRYNRMLKGTWGQIKNVGERAGGSITAGLFLEHFVKEGVEWAHLDIAGSSFMDAPVGPFGKGATGQVVRSLVSWAESRCK